MKRKTRSHKEKLLQISQLLTSVVLIIATVMQYSNIGSGALHLAIFLLGILQLIQAVLYCEMDRDRAAVSLFLACFVVLVCIGLLIL